MHAIRRLANALGLAVLVLGVAAPAVGQVTDWPSEQPPRALPAHEVKFPPYEIQKLSNGLQVVVVLHHEQPVISMRLLVRSGASSDPADKRGVGRLAAELLDQGTTTKTAQELADAIDFIGGAESTSAGSDLSYLNMLVMKDSFDVGMRMLSDMTRHPAYAPDEIERQRQQAISGMRVQQEDPSYIADAVFDRVVYGSHPYGMPSTGTPESIATITREDLLAFHDKYYVPNNAILAIVGDVTAEEAFAEARKVFGDWQQRDVRVEKPADPPEPARRLVVVNKPDAVQTEVRAGHLGIPRNHPDYMAVNLAIRILGGEGSNRLHQVLRTERGLTYGAQASMDAQKEAGDFEAQTNTRTEATGEVLRLIVDEFARLQRERVAEVELADAKAYLTGSFPLTIETPDAIAMQVLNVLFYDLPIDELQTFRDRVNAVTVDDIQRVARQYLRPDRLSLVLVGNAAGFSSQLKGLGFPSIETVDLSDLDLAAPGLKRAHALAGVADGGVSKRVALRTSFASAPLLYSAGAGQQALAAPNIEPKEGAAARALLDKVVAAKGGLNRLRTLKTVTVKNRQSMTSASGSTEAQTTTYLEYPGRFRVDMKMNGNTVAQVFDGERGWVRDPMGTHDVPDTLLREFRSSLRRDTVALLLAAVDGRVRVRALPDVKDADGGLHNALEFSAPDLEPIVVYVNPSTGLIERQTYVSGAPGQPLVEERFGDYRKVEGLQVAFSGSVRLGGQQVLERQVDSIAINDPIDPALFKRPQS